MAQIAQCFDPGHPGATLERMDFPLQVLHQFLVRQFVTPGVEQGVAAFQYFACFFQENRENTAVFDRHRICTLLRRLPVFHGFMLDSLSCCSHFEGFCERRFMLLKPGDFRQ